jgi:hypothetical protein
VQQVEIALAPMRGDEAQDGNEGEQQYEDDKGDPIDFLHGISPDFFFLLPLGTGPDRRRDE